MNPKNRNPWILVGICSLILLLVAIVFVEAALNTSNILFPSDASQTVVLFALTTLIVVALIVFILILSRYLIKSYVEPGRVQLGSKFKTKLLGAFLGLSFIPAIFLFIFAYGLINRSLDKWFSTPVDKVLDSARDIVSQYQNDFTGQTYYYVKQLAASPSVVEALRSGDINRLKAEMARSAQQFQIEAVEIFDREGKPVVEFHDSLPRLEPDMQKKLREAGARLRETADFSMDGNMEGAPFSVAGTGILDGRLRLLGSVAAVNLYPANLQSKIELINSERSNYAALTRDIKSFKKVKVLTLLLITISILFSASWIAIYLSKRITVPIQALAQATQKVAQGDLQHRVSVNAQDELKLLVDSFNTMTQELQEKSATIQRSTEELEHANRQLQLRRYYIETVVESIPTGVVSLTNDFQVAHLNSAARRILSPVREPTVTLGDLFDSSVTPVLEQMLARARVLSFATRDLTLPLGQDRHLYCAITACALRRDNEENLGYILVIEDLTELLKAQRSAAWREVARRMAHEIKNPLTPISLSAQRILKNLQRAHETHAASEEIRLPEGSLENVIEECATTIVQEVSALKSLVDEFSRFARLPSANPVPSNVNKIIEQTLAAYDGRLKEISIRKDLLVEIPNVQVDPEQFKRVLVNLIDNAVEAMTDVAEKNLIFKTRFDRRRETVEVAIEDSGHGVRPQDKDKLFLPYFSTKKRGTGLGLAIVDHIVADHNGVIRVEENPPRGTRFVIELPAINS